MSLAFLTWIITSSFDFGTVALLPQLLDRGRFLLFAFALLLFPDGLWQPAWTRTVAVASGVVFLIGVAETLGLIPSRLFLPLAIACVIASVVSLVSRFRTAGSYELRQQLKWVALGLVSGIGLILCARGGAALSALSPRIAAMDILWEAMFQLGIIVVALGFLVSLLRYRLFDAETVISRSAAYAALTIALVATFGGTEAAIENLGQLYLGMNVGSISGAMAAAVAAVLLNPLHGRISDWAEARFQPDLAQMKRQFPDLLARLTIASSTRGLASAVLPHINAAIHATRSALLIDGRVVAAAGVTISAARRGASDAMSSDIGDRMFAVSLSFGTGRSAAAACLLLGPRPDGTLYGREDLDAVRSIFPPLQQALESTMAREAIHADAARREKRLRDQLCDLHQRLSALEASICRDPVAFAAMR